MTGMWDLNIEAARRRQTWWWWFWLFFIDGGKDPRQMMVLWSTKNCKKIRVDDMWWTREKGVVKRKDGLDFDGMAASWFFDGERMYDPITLVKNDFRTETDGTNGSLVPMIEDGHDHLFTAIDGRYRVRVAKKGYALDATMTPDGPLGDHDYRDNVGTGKYGFDILRIKRLPFTGTLEHKGRTEDITGTAYFQKVMVNAPAPPWFWGAVHIEDGSYLQYFMPHVGLPMFRRFLTERSPFNRGLIPAVKNIEYYHAANGKSYKIKNLKVKRRIVDGHPEFTVSAHEGDVEMDFVLRTYARACWKFRQPLLGPIATLLYYNEYPSHLVGYNFRDGDDRWTFEDVGGGIGNVEHSWGLLF